MAAAPNLFGVAGLQVQQGIQQLQQGQQQLHQDIQQLQQGQQQMHQDVQQLQQGQQQMQQQMQQFQQQMQQQLAVLNPNAIALVAQDVLHARAANLAATAGAPLVAVPTANGGLPAAWPAGGASRALVTAGLPIAAVNALLADYGIVLGAGAGAGVRRQALLTHLGAALRL